MLSEEIYKISKLDKENKLSGISFQSQKHTIVYEYTSLFDPSFIYHMSCRVNAIGMYKIPSGFCMKSAKCQMYDLITIYNGSICLKTSRTIQTIPKNHVLFLNTDSDYVLTQEGAEQLEILIVRNQGFIAASYYNLLMQKTLHPIYIRTASFLSLLDRLRFYMAFPTNNNSVMIADTMTQIYSTLYLEYHKIPDPSAAYGYPQWLYDVILFLEKNLPKTINIPQLAKIAGISESLFYKLFREYTNYTPIQYINHLRIDRAKILLRNSDDQVQNIAREVGFSNTNYFIKKFSESTGQTPIEYRRYYQDQ